MILYEAPQGTEEWHAARAGVITASMFSTCRQKLKSGPSKDDFSSEAQAYAETLALHHPVHVAERVATLDVLSGGRLEVGIGRGFSPREHEVYGAGAVDPAITRESLEVFAREVAPAFRQP